MKTRNHLVIAAACAVVAWMPLANAAELTRHETRSSVVLYDYDTRAMIENPQGKTEVNSRQPLVTNADGAVRLVFSPQKPADVPEVNWIQTNPEKGFFAYFRWYSPTQAFFDRSWKMGNIVEVK
ncbi:MAG TPA: DUF1214 domain-containing protein [Thioalkalivibrio sp.]|nr:DUF1214 domain-containing protein [Thioalkalivibrio sp.]